MPCFRGTQFPSPIEAITALPPATQAATLAAMPPVQLQQLQAAAATKAVLSQQNLWFCTANLVGGTGECGAECIVVLVLAGIALALALYDAYNIQTCMKHLIAPRRHLVVMFLASGLYATVNGMSALFPASTVLWGGACNFLRVFFVYHYTLYLLSVLFVEGYGDVEELVEKAGAFLYAQSPDNGGPVRNAAWVSSCLFKVHVWMAEVVLSYMCKAVADDHLAYIAYEGRRVRIWDGGLIYIAIVDVVFTIVCGVGVSQLAGVVRPFLQPQMRTLVIARHNLFMVFYVIIALVYQSVITLVFAAHVDTTDEQYLWWSNHKAVIIAGHMLLFQYGMHCLFVPPYQMGLGRTKLLEIKSKLQSRKDVPAFLDELARRGFVLSKADTRHVLEADAAHADPNDLSVASLSAVAAGISQAQSNSPKGKTDVYATQFNQLAALEGGNMPAAPIAPKPKGQPDVNPVSSAEQVVADAVFDKVAGAKASSIDLKALSKYLVDRGDVPLDDLAGIFKAIDTNNDGHVDREEWRIGFTAGLLGNLA